MCRLLLCHRDELRLRPTLPFHGAAGVVLVRVQSCRKSLLFHAAHAAVTLLPQVASAPDVMSIVAHLDADNAQLEGVPVHVRFVACLANVTEDGEISVECINEAGKERGGASCFMNNTGEAQQAAARVASGR